MHVHEHSYVFRDPAIKAYDNFRVWFRGRLCSPDFNSKGAAAAYLAMLEQGQRKPEYAIAPIVAVLADAFGYADA